MNLSHAAIREGFWDIFFPSRCLGCNETLQYSKNEIFCPICHHNALISDTHLRSRHPLQKRLRAEFPFQLVLAKYRFPNHSQLISNLIYGLKYQNLKYVGLIEGREYGNLIAPLLREHRISALIPTPLHWRKEIKRGYNQSLEFARGLSLTTQIPILPKILRRSRTTRSQTQLNKYERLQNMKNAFSIRPRHAPRDHMDSPHFLLVDDVVTSGVTLAEMARTLDANFRNCTCSVCTLAYKDYS